MCCVCPLVFVQREFANFLLDFIAVDNTTKKSVVTLHSDIFLGCIYIIQIDCLRKEKKSMANAMPTSWKVVWRPHFYMMKVLFDKDNVWVDRCTKFIGMGYLLLAYLSYFPNLILSDSFPTWSNGSAERNLSPTMWSKTTLKFWNVYKSRKTLNKVMRLITNYVGKVNFFC